MSSDMNVSSQSLVRLPKNLLLFSLLTLELIPFLARLSIVPVNGWEWFTDYFFGILGFLFFGAFNLIPGFILYALGKGGRKTPLAYWFALSAGIGFLLYAHGTVNLRSGSTASIALIFIPLYGAGAVVAGWIVGFFLHFIIRNERGRIVLAILVGIVAIFLGAGSAFHETKVITQRQSQFPIIAVKNIPLTKRTVYTSAYGCRIEVLALDNFDSAPGNEIAVFNNMEVVLINPNSYNVKVKYNYKREECDRCVHMYPYIVSDGKSSLFIATSDGLADNTGHLLWPLKINGFTRLVPVSLPGQPPTFFSYHPHQSIERFDSKGQVLWSVKLDTSDIGTYVTSDGERLPFALTGDHKFHELKIFDMTGNIRKTIAIPEWAYNVQDISWPKRGNLLVGRGDHIGILDKDGKEILNHDIKDTSFNPYHGPDGKAVRFDPARKPYLAIMSHGSSGYARSVLLIFDPDGHLVWQEEVNKLRTMIAVPRLDGKSEMLLVGGMDGIVEYSLPITTKSN